MSDRGMKKWAPYKTLKEQWTTLDELETKIQVSTQPELSEDKMEEINELLVNYYGQVVEVSFYKRGFICKEKSAIKKIDTYERKLYLSNGKTVSLLDLVDLKNID